MRCWVFCLFSIGWQPFPNLDWYEHVSVGLGVSTHFRFKIGGVRQRDAKVSGWTRQACKVHFGFIILKNTSKSHFGMSALPCTCGCSAQQTVSSSEGNNGEMSASGEKNRFIVSGQY